ncbi:MucR family transcriptional regulator [Komagataeibacter oboediens]|uniref:MucR family transcriptional regulator n=1 Tax=Komagataeibacter oboediens TaxID=65958 RepID=UPI000237F3C1|nr:MucR family transcriptional regulator [Komagataeibacter oboediens]
MEQSDDLSPAIVIAMSDIVAAHLGNANTSLPTENVPAFIRDVYAAIRETIPAPAESEIIPRQQPAVPVAQSVFPDHLVCLEDGKKLKMLKRHLQTRYGMTPAQYREKWELPRDYPMVAPEYAKTRAALARDAGLGRKITVPTAAPVEEAAVVPSTNAATIVTSVEATEPDAPVKKATLRRARAASSETQSSTVPPKKVTTRKASAPKRPAKPRATRKAGAKMKTSKA